jgi:hypothetical protein
VCLCPSKNEMAFFFFFFFEVEIAFKITVRSFFIIIIYQIGEAVNESLSVFTKLLHKNNQNIVLAAKFYSPK